MGLGNIAVEKTTTFNMCSVLEKMPSVCISKETKISYLERSHCKTSSPLITSKRLRQYKEIHQRPQSMEMPHVKQLKRSKTETEDKTKILSDRQMEKHVLRVHRHAISLPDIRIITEADSKFWCRKPLCKRYSLRRSQSVEWDPVSALFTAATEDDAKELERILTEFELDVNFLSPTGVSLLQTAALVGSTRALKILVDYGAEIEFQDDNGRTALEIALFAGNFDCASLLINAGASMGKVVDGIKMY